MNLAAGTLPGAAGVEALQANAAATRPLSDIIIELVPRNPLDSAVRALDGEMLPLMVFALIFGVAVSRHGASADEDLVLIRVLEQIFDACMRIVHFAMLLAPLAVFAIVFNTAFTFGTAVFASLFFYVVTVVAGLLIQQFVVYSAVLWAFARRVAAGVLPKLPRGLSLRVLHRLVECHAAALARRRGAQAGAAARRLALRADRRERPPTRTARRSSRGSPCCSSRRSTGST